MSHFAQLDDQNRVIHVIVVSNADTTDGQGAEVEAMGQAFCRSLFGSDTRWVKTSYNASIRKNYAGIGYTYDPVRDAFISPKPFASWVLNESTCRWEAPVPYPTSGGPYRWNEQTQSWSL